jgi:hypothetical protein
MGLFSRSFGGATTGADGFAGQSADELTGLELERLDRVP